MRKETNKKVIEKIKPKIVEILRKNGVKKAGIFGSYARGEARKKSDVDIFVEISNKNLNLLDIISIKLQLEKAIKKKVDLVEYILIKPLIRKNILEEEVRIL